MSPSPSLISEDIQNTVDENNEDVISNLPADLADRILRFLPLSEVAKMSVLSKHWRNKWWSISSLCFDRFVCEKIRETFNGSDPINYVCSVISNILLLHQGPIHDFALEIFYPSAYLSRWLCFLSRNSGVKSIRLKRFWLLDFIPLPSHIYLCKELEQLLLRRFTLNPLPAEYHGFLHLRKLALISIKFEHDHTFERLIGSCPELDTLTVRGCSNVHSVIDAPKLESLILEGGFRSVDLKNVPKLVQLELLLADTKNLSCVQVAHAIKNLVSLKLGSNSLKLMVVGGLRELLPLPIACVTQLSLLNIDLQYSDLLFSTYGLLHSCPYVTKLTVSVDHKTKVDLNHKVEYDDDSKLDHLRVVEFTGLTGSNADKELIKYVLNTSTILEKMVIQFIKRDVNVVNLSKALEFQKELNEFQRASAKARLIFLD